jgi:hypothetical protein
VVAALAAGRSGSNFSTWSPGDERRGLRIEVIDTLPFAASNAHRRRPE